MPPSANNDLPRPNHIVTQPVRRVMLALVWPVLAEQFLNTLVGLVDTYLAGHLPHDQIAAATGAVGLAAYVGWLVTMLFALVGTGTTALVARAYGAQDRRAGNHIANQSLLLAAVMGTVTVFGMLALAPKFAGWLEMRGPAFDITVRYLQVDAWGYAIWAIGLVAAAALRGAGDMRTPLKVLTIVNVLNVCLSPALVNGWGPLPELGVDGIVAGTLVSRVTGGLLLAILMLRGRVDLHVRWHLLAPQRATIVRILRIGIPAALDGAVMWAGHFLFLKIVGHIDASGIDEHAFAAQIVVVRLEAFTYLPASAWAAACATMIGQALGANLPQRARRCGHEGVLQCGLLTAGVGLLFVLLSTPICGLMNGHPDVVALAGPILMLVGFFQPVLATTIVYIGGLRGAGDTVYPLVINACGLALIRIPGGYFFGITLGWGLFGAWIAVYIDLVVRAALSGARFARGRWVQTRV
jgi:MATE family multidrug resistance protein